MGFEIEDVPEAKKTKILKNHYYPLGKDDFLLSQWVIDKEREVKLIHLSTYAMQKDGIDKTEDSYVLYINDDFVTFSTHSTIRNSKDDPLKKNVYWSVRLDNMASPLSKKFKGVRGLISEALHAKGFLYCPEKTAKVEVKFI